MGSGPVHAGLLGRRPGCDRFACLLELLPCLQICPEVGERQRNSGTRSQIVVWVGPVSLLLYWQS
ncbi:Hypothetical predicted protein, partial [Pelobates cultripes]